MNDKKKIEMMILLTVIVLTGIFAFAGCKKQKEATMPATTKEATSQAAKQIEQTTCPVMGGPINKDIYYEYKGKKVYFCCSDCLAKFKAEPEKYLSKLPQFKN